MQLITICARLLFAAALAMSVGIIETTQAQDKKAADQKTQDAEKPYEIAADGTVSWPVFNGFRRFNSVCHTCHGPDGVGSTFAPALVDSLKRLDYSQFLEVVVNGKNTPNLAVEKRMPSFGEDRNVMCYIDDIYAYLKARSDNALGRGRPQKYQSKTTEASETEKSCMGG